jgi:hypothetical protein
VRDRTEERDAMASQGKPRRVCAASSNNDSVRSSRDVDVAMTEVLLGLLESVIWARFNRCQKNWRNNVRAKIRKRTVTNLVHQCTSTTPRITTNHHSTIVERKHEKQVAGPSHRSQGARCPTEINTDVDLDINDYVARHSLVYAPLP